MPTTTFAAIPPLQMIDFCKYVQPILNVVIYILHQRGYSVFFIIIFSPAQFLYF